MVACVTNKYALSANCRREISLADALKKPIIPLLMEETRWPPEGTMGPVFTELPYINMVKDKQIQKTWEGKPFEELVSKIRQYIPQLIHKVREETAAHSDAKDNVTGKTKTNSYKILENAKVGTQEAVKEQNAFGEEVNVAEASTNSTEKSNMRKSKACTLL